MHRSPAVHNPGFSGVRVRPEHEFFSLQSGPLWLYCGREDVMKMKIEKLSENQIRCTLTHEDLNSRNIRLSELAYGSSAARKLFQDMMQEARTAVGFDTGSSPIVIEAIPTSRDALTLLITKVDDPEELDARFSRFTRSEDSSDSGSYFLGADDVMELFQRIYEARSSAEADKKEASAEAMPLSGSDAIQKDAGKEKGGDVEKEPINLVESFHFDTLDDLILAAHNLERYYSGKNTLYRHHENGRQYQLILHQSGMEPKEFNKICNILSEYGRGENFTPAQEAFLREHGDVLMADSAIQQLANL